MYDNHLIHMRDKTGGDQLVLQNIDIHVCHVDSFISVTYIWWHMDSFTSVTSTHSYVWHPFIHMCDINLFVCVTWLEQISWSCRTSASMVVMSTLSYVWHIYSDTWTHSYVWHPLIHMCDIHSFICVTWLEQINWSCRTSTRSWPGLFNTVLQRCICFAYLIP